MAWEEREEPRTLRISLRSGTRAATRAYLAYARVPLFCGKSGTFGTSTLHPCHECVLLCTGSAYSATIRELSGIWMLHPCHVCSVYARVPLSLQRFENSRELRRCTHATSVLRLCTGSAYSATIRELSGIWMLHPCHSVLRLCTGSAFLWQLGNVRNFDAAPMLRVGSVCERDPKRPLGLGNLMA